MNYNTYENKHLPELKFDKNRSRVKNCPCGRDNKDFKFAPYVGFEDKGYCHSCSETFLPELQKVRGLTIPSNQYIKSQVKPKTKIDYIPYETFKKCLGKDLDKNNFVKYLITLFGKGVTKELIERYYISTSKLWNAGTVFWQIDVDKKIRSGKIMLYNPITGKRDKTKNNWVHSILKLKPFNLKQVFFGEHLLIDKSKMVAIVEGDKTSVIMSYYLPQYIWLSSSGKEGLNADKFKVLQGRSVILFPDLSKTDAKINCFELWSKKAIKFKNIANIEVSDYLEKIATEQERKEGLDLADYLIKYCNNEH